MITKNWQSRCEQLGDVTELAIATKLREQGEIALPYGDAAYDILFRSQRTGKFVKIQTKHAKLYTNKSGTQSIVFRTVDKNGSKYPTSEVDYFAVWNRDSNKHYLVKNKGDVTRVTLAITESNRTNCEKAIHHNFDTVISSI